MPIDHSSVAVITGAAFFMGFAHLFAEKLRFSDWLLK